ncbi:DUF1731 domain-containing protein, partial [Enterobacter hormaechei]
YTPPSSSGASVVYTRHIRLWMGESAGLVLGGQRPRQIRLEAAGFAFGWYDLEEAVGDVVY